MKVRGKIRNGGYFPDHLSIRGFTLPHTRETVNLRTQTAAVTSDGLTAILLRLHRPRELDYILDFRARISLPGYYVRDGEKSEATPSPEKALDLVCDLRRRVLDGEIIEKRVGPIEDIKSERGSYLFSAWAIGPIVHYFSIGKYALEFYWRSISGNSELFFLRPASADGQWIFWGDISQNVLHNNILEEVAEYEVVGE